MAIKKPPKFSSGKPPPTSPLPTAQEAGKWKYGHLQFVDELPKGDPKLASALNAHADYIDINRKSRHWRRTVGFVENILFSAGAHYINDILAAKLSADSTAENITLVTEASRSIPRPVNDLLGRFVETNISLLTENKPIPRVTPKSGKAEDEDAAELSELTLEYMWEALKMPEKHREMARLLLHCGVCWMEVVYDPTVPRRITIPQVEPTMTTAVPGLQGEIISAPVPGFTTKFDERGRPVYTDRVEYGDITSTIISPFEMHLPVLHYWNGPDMQWLMREYYVSKATLVEQFSHAQKMGLNRKDGWYLDRLEWAGTSQIKNLPLWWWERLSDLVEGPGPSLYVGTPEQWEGYTVVRIFDRKPNKLWPRGRTVMVAGDQVIYDSPKERGARAYDPRWPERWHPYIRFRWEGMTGNIYGRSLVSKLLPHLKRINAIDTAIIMYRRTVPMAGWLVPQGAHPVEDLWVGQPGLVWQYDARRTDKQAPQPIYPPPFPESLLVEREQQLTHMESIAGTEQILKGERPIGINSGAALDILRKQALVSRSPTLQAWDESLQEEGTAILQEVIKNIRKDASYAERLRIIARENHSTLTVDNFSGTDLSDNVIVRIDTASMALVSREARQAKVLEFLQYLGAGGLMSLQPGLRQSVLDELGFSNALNPSGPDVNRAKRMLAFIRQKQFRRVIPMQEDDPYVFYELLVQEVKADSFWNYDAEQAMFIFSLMDKYRQMVEQREAQILKLQQLSMANNQGGRPPGQGGGGA